MYITFGDVSSKYLNQFSYSYVFIMHGKKFSNFGRGSMPEKHLTLYKFMVAKETARKTLDDVVNVFKYRYFYSFF